MTNIHELKNRLLNGEYDAFFVEELGYDIKIAAQRVCAAVEKFDKNFADEKCAIFSAPGRTELGGNHTDHQRGNILAAAVNADMLCVASVTDNNCISIVSEGFGKVSVDLDIKKPIEEERGTAAALIRGVAVWFEYHGCKISGVNAYISSEVPIGSGMSSSAAFEVLVGAVINSFFAQNRFSKIDIAKAGLFAENKYFGKPCGLMDQIACAFGGIVSVDFKNPDEPRIIPLQYDFNDNGYTLCLISTGGSHEDLTAEYKAITDEMYGVAFLFGESYLSDITQTELIRNAVEVRNKCGDRAYVRSVNYFEENYRARVMSEALRDNDLTKYLDLVNDSGRCSFMYLQNIYPSKSTDNQPITVALQAAQLCLKGKGAFRVHGGGFAGTIQAYVPNDMVDEFVAVMESVLFEGCCKTLKIRKQGVTEVVTKG